jgi:hypothetical protein
VYLQIILDVVLADGEPLPTLHEGDIILESLNPIGGVVVEHEIFLVVVGESNEDRGLVFLVLLLVLLLDVLDHLVADQLLPVYYPLVLLVLSVTVLFALGELVAVAAL